MSCLSSQQVLKDKKTRDPNSVTSLSLTHKALTGVSCLGEFRNLERLDLASNDLTSLQGLSSCVNLKWLSVVQNKLESLKGIEKLSKLTVLNAGKNKLKSINEVRSIVSIRALILNDNEILSICKLDQLKELNTLVLSRNPIHEIGDSLVEVKSITKLSLSNCQLQTIDSSLKSCIELKELRLAHNDIKTLPAELAYNKKLQNLDLGNNVITRWSDVKVLNSLADLRNLNLQGNPIAEDAKITKKVLKYLPNLHVFNARPVDKSTKNGNGGGANGSKPVTTNKLDDHKKREKDHTREMNPSDHVPDQIKSCPFDNVGNDADKDLKQRWKKTKGKLLKEKETSTDEKDDTLIEKQLKRKETQEKQGDADDLDMEHLERESTKTHKKLSKDNVSIHDDDSTKVGKKQKIKKHREKLSELDIIDNGEASFVDLFSIDAAENPKYGTERKTVDRTVKDRSVVSTVQFFPAVEVGMGGPSTWGDE